MRLVIASRLIPRLAAIATAILGVGLPTLGLCAPKAAPADTDAYVAHAMQAFGAPGLSLAIVQDGETVLAKGYGVRSLATGSPVDAHTAFPIGSESKAFTAAALAILVDRKQLSWQDRVVDRLPGFRMYDPYATVHMTVRDLLTHRSGLGLGEGDLLVVPATTRSRADIVHALRYLKPATCFRETFAYDNILYIVAGALVEAVSGQTWEAFVQTNIFKPAGMVDASADYVAGAPDAVALHARTSGAIRGLGDQAVLPARPGLDTDAPAGGVNASADDMARWMKVQLAQGALADGGRLFSTAQAAQMWAPAVVVPPKEAELPAPLSAMQPDLQTYALGWFVESYRGHVVIEHSGAVLGGLAMLYLIPDRHVGISVAINSEDGGTRRAVMFHLLDAYLGLPPTDWLGALKTANMAMATASEAALKASSDVPSPLHAGVSLPVDRYVGRYRDPWYGEMTVQAKGRGELAIRFERTPGMVGALEPAGRDRFRTRWADRGVENAYVTFSRDGGQIRGARLVAVSPLADFSFDYQDLHFVKARRHGRPVGARALSASP